MSDSFGRALKKVTGPGGGGDGAIVDTRHDNTMRQRRFEYEDGIIVRSVEAREQIGRMYQPFVFTREQLLENHLIPEGDETNEDTGLLLEDLRNRITLRRPGLGATVLVTSVSGEEQPPYFARNLAAVFARDENRTSLLVELQPTKGRLWGDAEAVAGLADFVSSDVMTAKDVIQPTGVPRMRIIPFGKTDTPGFDFIRSTRMRILVKDITRRYPRERFTILDAPPVDKVADVELLNEYADFTLLYVPYGKVSEGRIRKSLAKLDPEKFLGVVLCGLPRMPGFLAGMAK
jgi:Mrp family chromosome partitioning ATPase